MTQDDDGSAQMLGSQPVAWAVAIGDKGRVLDGIFISKAKADEVLEWRNENTEYGARLIPLYEHPKPTLTGDEREAVSLAGSRLSADPMYANVCAVLFGLLKRTK